MIEPPLVRRQEHLGTRTRFTMQARRETCRQDASAQEVSSADFLDRLLAEEMAAKRANYVAMRTVLARFPDRKPLERFDCSVHPAVDRKKRQERAACRCIAHGDTLVCLGPPGTGKTQLAIGLGLKAVQ